VTPARAAERIAKGWGDSLGRGGINSDSPPPVLWN
jgi:hypothetical protein